MSVHTQARYTEMKATASIDGLTGVFNKRYLTHRLAEEMRKAQDDLSSLSVFIFDVDNFKHYNDSNGHVAGDRLLQRLAKLVVENVRKDTIFGVSAAQSWSSSRTRSAPRRWPRPRTCARRSRPTSSRSASTSPSASTQASAAGSRECPVDGSDAATLVRAADEALDEAKRWGCNPARGPDEPTYLGGDEAQMPLPIEGNEDPRERAAHEQAPAPGTEGKAVALAADMTPPRGTRVAADFTPTPGTLLAIASCDSGHRRAEAHAAAHGRGAGRGGGSGPSGRLARRRLAPTT